MSGTNIDLVRDCSTNFAQEFYNRSENLVKLSALLFNHSCNSHESKSFDDFKSFMDSHCQAEGGTDFSKPLGHILNLISTQAIEELQVLFLTDGQDGNVEATKSVSLELKEALNKREIYSRFSVIGVGSYDASFLKAI